MTQRGISGVIVAAALAALLAVGCGGGRAHGVDEANVTPAPRCTAGLHRPVGSAGVSWAAVVVRPAFAYRAPARARIVVDLSERRVRFFKWGRLVLSSTAAVGSSATPTPLGRYYVNQRLIPRDRGGPFGPGAVGISAFSPVLTGWAQGGPIAIHGTNQPWSIGQAGSNGGIRLPDRGP